jgi:hypothetical protein
MVRKLERHTACLMKRRLNYNCIVYIRLKSFKNHVELPTTTAALIYYEFGLSLEWPEGFESQTEEQGLVGV